SNIDVTAAMVELAGAESERTLDGRSLAPLLSDTSAPWNRATLLQCHHGMGLATHRYRYMEWRVSGQVELYDMLTDQFQLNNVAGKSDCVEVRKSLAEALQALQGCGGAACSWTKTFPRPPRTGTN